MSHREFYILALSWTAVSCTLAGRKKAEKLHSNWKVNLILSTFFTMTVIKIQKMLYMKDENNKWGRYSLRLILLVYDLMTQNIGFCNYLSLSPECSELWWTWKQQKGLEFPEDIKFSFSAASHLPFQNQLQCGDAIWNETAFRTKSNDAVRILSQQRQTPYSKNSS